jgi:hypothetical protein
MRSFKDTFAVMVTSRSIGLVDQYCDAETSVYYEWNWLWKTRPVTIHSLVRKTDLLRRLALLFGTDFSVVARPVAVKTLEGFDGVKVYKTELQLHYYPMAYQDSTWTTFYYTQEKYADYKAPVTRVSCPPLDRSTQCQ